MLDKIKKKAQKEGITVTGNIASGEFSGVSVLGRIAGTYTATPGSDAVVVSLTQKPLLVPAVLLRRILSEVFRE